MFILWIVSCIWNLIRNARAGRVPACRLLTFLAVVVVVSPLSAYAPRHVLFTWQGDTSTTLTVNYQTIGTRAPRTQVFYDTESRQGVVKDYRQQRPGISFQVPGLQDRWFHRVELTDLQPGAAVWLVAGDPALGVSREYQVRTIPAGDEPLRFVTGGDLGANEDARRLMRAAAATSPDFAIIGGDVAYANGRLDNIGLWESWLTYWSEEMVTPDGRSIPLVVAIGNHEVQTGYRGTREQAPYYFAVFGQDPEDSTYFARRFGRNLALFVLDSGHIVPHEGAQTEWLERALAEHRDARFTAAVYHVPLYPSSRSYEGGGSVAGREHWLPVFDRHRLTVAFENHDHTYKRTSLLRGNRVVDEDGTLYLGDGCWGRPPRSVTYGGRWYLKRSGPVLHFWAVEVSTDGMVYRAIDDHGRVFDVYPEDAPGAAEAEANFRSIPMEFQLPAGAVSVTRIVTTESHVSAGASRLRISNPYEFALHLVVTAGATPAGARWLELPPPFALGPGEAVEHELRFVSDRPLPVGETQLRLKISAERPSSDAGPSVRFADEVRVQVRRPEEVPAGNR